MNNYITKINGQLEAFVTGSRRDSQANKTRYDLISPILLRRLADLLQRGAEIYGERNWEKGQPVSRSFASMLRHVYQFQEGEDTEDHLAAVVFGAMTIMHVEELVKQGKLPVELMDMQHYEGGQNHLQALDRWVLQHLEEHPDREFGFYELRDLLIPDYPEALFTQVMARLLKTGLVDYRVDIGEVHPMYRWCIPPKDDDDDDDENDEEFDRWDYAD